MAEPFYIIDNAKFEMVNSKYAMTTICNILMNLVVLENKVVEDAHIFYHLLKFIMNTLPSLENNGEVSCTCSWNMNFCKFVICLIIFRCWCYTATSVYWASSFYRSTQDDQNPRITRYFASSRPW